LANNACVRNDLAVVGEFASISPSAQVQSTESTMFQPLVAHGFELFPSSIPLAEPPAPACTNTVPPPRCVPLLHAMGVRSRQTPTHKVSSAIQAHGATTRTRLWRLAVRRIRLL
jgi:hypothetical protein